MTGRSPLAERYCRQVAPADDPARAAHDSPILRLAYQDRFLPGPAFLEAAERHAVLADLHACHDLLRSLPDRLFGGDLAALATAVGMDPRQTALTVRGSRIGRLLPFGRADLYHDGTGFRLLEFNLTSALGGFENADLARAMLAYPPLGEYAAAHGLGFADTVDAMVGSLLAECAEAVPAGRPARVAVVDTTANFAIVGARLGRLAGMLSARGVDAIAADLGRITYPDGRPTAEGRPIDVVLRYFLAEDLTDPVAAAQIELLLTAAERGRAAIFSRLDSEVYGSKGALSLLSDDRHHDLFTAPERACLDRLLPWTRAVRPRVTDPGGTRVDLAAYARARRVDLVLKPLLLHGGSGVVPGWRTTAAEWDRQVAAAMSGPYVVQERVRPAAEPLPGGTGYFNWGIYLGDPAAVGGDGYAGGFIRSSPDPDVGVLSMADGAAVGGILTAPATGLTARPARAPA